MAAEIKTDHININGQNITLVSVNNGKNLIGVCSAGYNMKREDSASINKIFYIGADPVINILCPNHGDKYMDKLISMSNGYGGMAENMHDSITECFDRANNGDSLETSLHNIFTFLSDGVYTLYTAEYYPTDGNGTFFWGAYNIPHEVNGTSEFVRTIGASRTFTPCFLIPGTPLDMYLAKTKAAADEVIKKRQIQGIVYHLSGLHSVLLKGHHGAVSCAMAGVPFKCAVIEKIAAPYTEVMTYIPNITAKKQPVESLENEEMFGFEDEEQPSAPAPAEPEPVAEPEVIEHEGITGFRSPSVKIPIEMMPRHMLNTILQTHSETKPSHFSFILQKNNVIKKKSYTNNILPLPALENCDRMPDCEMIESANAIDGLSQDQLDALLAGNTEYNGNIIISPNFYTSIVTACNYLQFHDKQRFVTFSLSILDNPDLYATHEYIARRIARIDSNRIYDFFREAVSANDPRYEKIMGTAESYIKDYDLNHAG